MMENTHIYLNLLNEQVMEVYSDKTRESREKATFALSLF
jgi:hypothetical protein